MPDLIFSDEPILSSWEGLPRHAIDWQEAATWSGLGITAFSAKALYTFGIMRHSIEASGCLLDRPRHDAFYLGAYLLAATAVELFGRCLMGDQRIVGGSPERLRRGLQYVASLPDDNEDTLISVPNSTQTYTIRHCIALRNFAAHGSGAVRDRVPIMFDPPLIFYVLRELANSMERYAQELQYPSAGNVREALALAAVMPLFSGDQPLFIRDVHGHLRRGGTVASELLHSDMWRV